MVQDLLREREQLKSELAGQASTPHEEEGRPKKARSLASPSSDLMSVSNQPALGNCRDPSRLKETLINSGYGSQIFLGVGVRAGGCVMWRDARYGLLGVWVGEAEKRGPPTQDCSAAATACCSEDGSVPATIGGRFAVAGLEDSSPVLDWLTGRLASAPRLEIQEGTINAEEAVRLGWLTLRPVGPFSNARTSHSGCGDKVLLAHSPETTYLPWQRVALLDASFVAVVLHLGRQLAVLVHESRLCQHPRQTG